MSGSREDDDGSKCPFCGKDAAEAWGEWCDHLVADWSPDADENGGVLGEGRVGYVDGVNELALACQAMNAVLVDADATVYEAKLTALRDVLPLEKRPAWWPNLCDALSEQEGEPIGETPYEFGRIPTRLMPAPLIGAPGIIFTYSDLGRRVSSGAYFVWSENPITGREAIASHVGTATEIIKGATETVRTRFQGHRGEGTAW